VQHLRELAHFGAQLLVDVATDLRAGAVVDGESRDDQREDHDDGDPRREAPAHTEGMSLLGSYEEAIADRANGGERCGRPGWPSLRRK